MTKRVNISWTAIRTALFLIVGLMNTMFIRPEDIGTWKNYIGYALLFLALIDGVLLFTLILKKKNNYIKVKLIVFKILALIIPFYFIYFPQLHEDSENHKIRQLWKYVIAGFALYIIGIVVYIQLQ